MCLLQMCLRRGCGRVPRAFDRTCVSLADVVEEGLRQGTQGFFAKACMSLADVLEEGLRQGTQGFFAKACISLADTLPLGLRT